VDGWHQYMHPYYWSRNMLLEAELYSKKITTSTNAKDDYTKFTSFASIDATIEIPFSFHGKTTKIKSIKLWIKNEFESNNLTLKLNQHQIAQLKILRQEKIQPYIIPMPSIHQNLINGKYVLTLSVSKPGLKLDKIEIETNE
jgi:hypothetical protein